MGGWVGGCACAPVLPSPQVCGCAPSARHTLSGAEIPQHPPHSASPGCGCAPSLLHTGNNSPLSPSLPPSLPPLSPHKTRTHKRSSSPPFSSIPTPFKSVYLLSSLDPPHTHTHKLLRHIPPSPPGAQLDTVQSLVQRQAAVPRHLRQQVCLQWGAGGRDSLRERPLAGTYSATSSIRLGAITMYVGSFAQVQATDHRVDPLRGLSCFFVTPFL